MSAGRYKSRIKDEGAEREPSAAAFGHKARRRRRRTWKASKAKSGDDARCEPLDAFASRAARLRRSRLVIDGMAGRGVDEPERCCEIATRTTIARDDVSADEKMHR